MTLYRLAWVVCIFFNRYYLLLHVNVLKDVHLRYLKYKIKMQDTVFSKILLVIQIEFVKQDDFYQKDQ